MNASEYCRALTPRYVTIDGIRTHYVECGTGTAVVLLHGLSACLWNWWRNLPELAQHFRVIAYDLKGCGNSDKPRGSYTVDACAAQLLGLLDHLGIRRAALIGHSMGTRIALHTAIVAAPRVETLVLVSPSCYPQTSGRPISLLTLPGVGELYAWAVYAGRVEQVVRSTLRFCMHPSAIVDDEDVYWNMQMNVRQKRRFAQAYLRYVRQMQFHKPWTQARRYSQISAPTLIISGDSDRYVPVAHCHQLAGVLPNAQLELWADTGHLPHTERPDRFNTTVCMFLQRHHQTSDQAEVQAPQYIAGADQGASRSMRHPPSGSRL